jgi:RNA polymerase I-specific transcription initiation factor RRN3
MPLPATKRKLETSSSSPSNGPPAKRRNYLGTPKFSSTPNNVNGKGDSVGVTNSTIGSSPAFPLTRRPSKKKGEDGKIITPIRPSVNTPTNTLITKEVNTLTPIRYPAKANLANSAVRKAVNSSNSSLLKSILKQESGTVKEVQPTPNKCVSFGHIPDFVDKIKSKTAVLSSADISQLLDYILDNKEDDRIIFALEKLRENVDNIDSDQTELIEKLVNEPWASRPSDQSKAYQQFFISLLSHHPSYCKVIIKSLLKQFKGEEGQDIENYINYIPIPSLVQKNTNRFVKIFLRNFPRERKELLKQIQNNFPYYKRPDTSVLRYLEGILGMYKYMSDAGKDILEIVIENLIKLDASITKQTQRKYAAHLNNSQQEKSEESGEKRYETVKHGGEAAVDSSSDSEDDISNDTIHEETISPIEKIQCTKMDLSMQILFNFVRDQAFVKQQVQQSKDITSVNLDNESLLEKSADVGKSADFIFSADQAEPLMKSLLALLTTHILYSDKLQNVHYVIYYLINQKKEYIREFLSITWHVFKSVNEASVIRQAAVAHFGGILCRSLNVNAKTLRKRLKHLIAWIRDYMNKDSSGHCDYMVANLAAHGPFYSACQSAFYIIAFRHRDLVDAENDDTSYLRDLDLNMIISHPLNPLRVVSTGVVREFAKVTIFYQVAYCKNIIDRNKRITLPVIGLSSSGGEGKPLLLDDHFPYERYVLSRTNHLIDPYYREFEPLKDHVPETSSDEEEDDLPEKKKCPSISSMRTRTISVTEMISNEIEMI